MNIISPLSILTHHMYEIHVLVDPSQERLLNDNILLIQRAFPNLLSCKDMATVTSTGVYPRQPMVSGFVNMEKIKAVSLAQDVEVFLVSIGLTVFRVKVEQLVSFNESTDTAQSVTGDDYYEAHIKVGQSLPESEEYEQLARLCLTHGVQLLLNPYSIKKAPVTTMRLYDVNMGVFKERHERLLKDLQDQGFTIRKQHLERGVYDSNVFTDKGWLFEGDDYKTPVTTVDCPERLQLPAAKLPDSKQKKACPIFFAYS